MLVERKYDLPPDICYILDGACEVHEILGCHHYALSTYGDPNRIDAITALPTQGKYVTGRRQMMARVCDYANEIILVMPEREREWMASLAYSHARRIIEDYTDFLAGWNFEDSLIGGCAISFRNHVCMDRDGNPTPKAMRRLHSPSAVRRYVKLYDDMGFLLAPLGILKHLPKPAAPGIADEFYREQERRLNARRDAQYAAMREIVDREGIKPPKAKKKDAQDTTARKIVKRAAVMASALLGAATVSAFAKGEAVTLQGAEVNFQIRATSKLSAMGHGGIRIMLSDKAGEKLGGLCVYHEGTPALDQLTAFALRVEAGEEGEILKVGNLYQVTPAGADHALLKAHVKRPDERFHDPFWGRGTSPTFRVRRAEYLGKMGPVYREAIAIRLFGRRAKEVMTA